jgi:hypothetical protein
MQLKYHQEILDLLIHVQRDLQAFIREKAQEPLRLSDNPRQRRDEIARHRRWLLHWRLFTYLVEKPCLLEANIRQLNAVERRYSVTLPASVREWYSLNFVSHLMAIRGYEKVAAPAPIIKWQPFTARDWDESQRHDLWMFMFYEFINQGGDDIAFKIDEGEDPPVFAEADEEIFELSQTFSGFISLFFGDWVVDRTFKYHLTISNSHTLSRLSQSVALPQGRILTLEDLRPLYQEQHGNRKVRFYDENLQIRASINGNVVSHATFYARTSEQLVYHISNIWGDDGPMFRIRTNHEGSQPILHKMRSKYLLRILQTLNGWISAGDLASHFNCSVQEILVALAPLVESQVVDAHFENKHWLPHTQRYRNALSLR